MVVVEIKPQHDFNQKISFITADRLFTNFVRRAVRAGYFDKR